MYHSGIGGGGFALVRNSEGTYVGYPHFFTKFLLTLARILGDE